MRADIWDMKAHLREGGEILMEYTLNFQNDRLWQCYPNQESRPTYIFLILHKDKRDSIDRFLKTYSSFWVEPVLCQNMKVRVMGLEVLAMDEDFVSRIPPAVIQGEGAMNLRTWLIIGLIYKDHEKMVSYPQLDEKSEDPWQRSVDERLEPMWSWLRNGKIGRVSGHYWELEVL